MQKGILCLVVRALDRFLETDRVNDGGCAANVEDLHDRVVNRVKTSKKIQIPSHKDQKKEFVRSYRNT
jgi:hypothetical protein